MYVSHFISIQKHSVARPIDWTCHRVLVDYRLVRVSQWMTLLVLFSFFSPSFLSLYSILFHCPPPLSLWKRLSKLSKATTQTMDTSEWTESDDLWLTSSRLDLKAPLPPHLPSVTSVVVVVVVVGQRLHGHLPLSLTNDSTSNSRQWLFLSPFPFLPFVYVIFGSTRMWSSVVVGDIYSPPLCPPVSQQRLDTACAR